MPSSNSMLTEFATVAHEIKRLEARVSALKDKRDNLEERCRDYFIDSGISSMRIDRIDNSHLLDDVPPMLLESVMEAVQNMGKGEAAMHLETIARFLDGETNRKSTLYLYKQFWAGNATDEDGRPLPHVTTNALAHYYPTSQFVKPSYNVNTVSSWIRELPRDETDTPILPPELYDKVRVTEKISVRVRKG